MGWFGPSQNEVWGKLSAEMEGRFRAGAWFTGARVDVDVGEWTLTLDSYTQSDGKVSHTYTRLRAPYVNPSRFRFKIFREGFFASIGKAFGMQDVQVGVPDFDRAWVVRGRDEARLRELFRTESIRRLLAGAGDVSFEVRHDEGWFGKKFPEGVDELVLTTYGLVRDVPRLKVLFALFAETLDRLVEMGAASSDDPGVTL